MRMSTKKSKSETVNVDNMSYYAHQLFPTPVVFSNINRKFTKDELDFLRNHSNGDKLRVNTGNHSSKNNNVLEEEVMKDIKQYCKSFVDKYLQEIICPMHDVELYITQSWLNRTTKGEFHHRHNHANSIISGVFYINASPELDKIIFYRDGYQQLQVTKKSWNDFNSESWWFTVRTGDIVLFPSHLTHMVENVVSDKPRISLAFNTFYKGYVGENDALTGLHLGYETPIPERKYKELTEEEKQTRDKQSY